jgi:hypothetical protein
MQVHDRGVQFAPVEALTPRVWQVFVRTPDGYRGITSPVLSAGQCVHRFVVRRRCGPSAVTARSFSRATRSARDVG